MHCLRISVDSSTIVYYTTLIRVITSTITQTHSHMVIQLHYIHLLSPIQYNCIMTISIFHQYIRNLFIFYITNYTHPYLSYYHHHILLLSSHHLHKSTHIPFIIKLYSNPYRIKIYLLSNMYLNLMTQCNLLHYTNNSYLTHNNIYILQFSNRFC